MKTIEELNKITVSPEIQAKLLSARRQSTSEDLIREVTKKYPLPDKDTETIPTSKFRDFTLTQAVMLRTGIYLTIDWDKMEYYCFDIKLGKEYRA